MERICKYCNIKNEYINHQTFACHVKHCKLNPNKNNGIEKYRETILKRQKEYIILCPRCGKEKKLLLTERRYIKGKYMKHCSRHCSNIREQTEQLKEQKRKKQKGHRNNGALKYYRGTEKRICPICKIGFVVKVSNQNKITCGKKCGGKFRLIKDKYPNRNIYNNKEHRILIEKQTNRKLTYNEVIHHKNGIRNDNRIENLELMSRSNHAKLHNEKLRIRRHSSTR